MTDPMMARLQRDIAELVDAPLRQETQEVTAIVLILAVPLAFIAVISYAFYVCAVDIGWMAVPCLGGPLLFASTLIWAFHDFDKERI